MSPKEKTPKPDKKAAPAPVMTETSERERSAAKNYITIMVVVIVAIALVGGFGIYWLATRYSREANKIKAQDEQIKLLVQKQENLETLKPNYDAIISPGANGVSDAKLILQALPIDQAFNALIAMLEKMGQQSGVKITSVTPATETSTTADGGSEQSSAPKTLSFTVAVEGSYQGLLDFLKKTEQSSRVINFSSMTLKGGTGGSIQADLTMDTYWQPPANIEPTERPLQ